MLLLVYWVIRAACAPGRKATRMMRSLQTQSEAQAPVAAAAPASRVNNRRQPNLRLARPHSLTQHFLTTTIERRTPERIQSPVLPV